MQEQRLDVMVAISRAVTHKDDSCATLVPVEATQTFLQKFYKRNLSVGNRINEVRLARFNALLYKLHEQFATLPGKDVEVLLLSVCGLVNKVAACPPDEDRLKVLTASYHWIGKVLPVAAEHSQQAAKLVVDLLEYLLRAKKLNIPTLEDYFVLLEQAEVLKRIEITAEDEAAANGPNTENGILDELDETSALLRQCDLSRLFTALLHRHESQQDVLELLLICQKKCLVGSKIHFFWQTVVNPQQTSHIFKKEDYTKMLEYAISKGEFDVKGKQKLQQALLQLNTDIPVNIIQLQTIFPESVLKSADPQLLRQLMSLQNNIPAAIELFENPAVESYAPLYVILKSNVTLPKEKLQQLLKFKDLPNRRAILIAFVIGQHRKTAAHDLLKLYSSVKEPTRQQRLRTIHFLHFSLQSTALIHLLTQIMEQVPTNKLNNECDFSLLPLQPLEKAKFDKAEKALVSGMLSQETEPSERMYRVKIDLLSLMGEASSLPVFIENIAKYTSKKPDELIESLQGVTDDTLLELLLMKVNRTFESTDVGEISAKLVDWAFKTHTKQMDEYRKATKRYFTSIGLDGYHNLALALKAWNLASKESLSIPQLAPFLSPPERERIVDDNYVNFLVRTPNTTPIDQCLRAESRVRELETFIGFLDEKHFGKKQFKKIIEWNSQPQMFLLQALHSYFEVGVNQPELLRAIISKLNPDAEVQEQAEKRLEEYEVNLEGVEYYFEQMLSQAYPEALTFICKLIKSKNPKDDKQAKRKKSKRKDKEECKDFPTRVINSFLDCIQLALGTPQRLGSNFQELIETIDRLIRLKCVDDVFVDSLIVWVGKFRGLTMPNYEAICLMVANLKSFWSSAEKLLSERIQLTQIETQVDFITGLIASTRQFAEEPKYEQLYNNLLTIVHILYSMQHVQQMEGRTATKLPQARLRALPEKYRVRSSNEGIYFFCDTCQKHVCESCASFMHRNHDKSYVNRDKGTCNHEGDQRKKERKPEEDMDELQRMELLAMDPERLAHYKRYEKERDRKERERERDQFEAMRLKEEIMLNYQAQAAARQGGTLAYVNVNPSNFGFGGFSFGGGINPGLISAQGLPNPAPSNPPANSVLVVTQTTSTVNSATENEDNLEIKSTTEKSIIESVGRCSGEFSDPHFVQHPPEGSEGPGNKVSMAGLLTELMQSVEKQSQKRYGEKELDCEANSSLDKFTFDATGMQVVMELQNEKYIMFKINNPRGSGEEQEMERRGRSVPNRAMACSNGRILAIKIPIDGADILMFYHEGKLRRSLKKRERGKKYGETEPDTSFQTEKRQVINFEVVSMSFSKKNPSLMLVCGDSHFQLYTLIEGRDCKRNNYSVAMNGDRIIKAAWLPESSNRILLVGSREIRLVEFMDVTSSSNFKIVGKYSSAKPIADFQLAKEEESSVVHLYVSDHEGNLFHERITDEEKVCALSNKIAIPGFEGNEGVTSLLVSEQPGLCLMAFREGSNLLCRMRDRAISKMLDLRLQALISPRSESFTTMDRSGHVVFDAKLIYSSKEAAIIVCMLRKDGQNTGGNVAVIELSSANSVHIQCLNGNNRTDSYEVMPYDDEGQSERFMIMGIQNDGTVWVKPYEVRISLTQAVKQEDLSEDRLEEYNKLIREWNLLTEVGGGNRKIDFKECSGKLNSVNMNETAGEKLVLTLNSHVFVMGLILRADNPGLLTFRVFDQEYEFNIRQPRQVQIPFNLKETLQAFVTRSITVHIPKKYAIEVYVMPWDKPSVYYDAYRELVRLHTNYYSFDGKDAKNYFNNAERSDFMNIGQEALQKVFKESKLELINANFILEMELLVQALDRNGMSLSLRQLEQFLGNIKRFLLIDHVLVRTTVNRLFRKVFWLYRIIAVREGRSVSLGDPYDYHTFKDLFWVQKLYRDFLNRTSLSRLDQLLEKLHHLKYKRLANLYLMFGIFPKMLMRICEFYRRQLDNSLEGSRQRMNDRVSLIVKLLCQHYQYNKNRGNVDSEIETFYLLELLLSGISKNKEIYKDIILRAFYCFETLPTLKGPMEFSYGCRLFEVSPSALDRNVLGSANSAPSAMEEEEPPEEQYKRSEEEEQSDMRPYDDLEWGVIREPSMIVEESNEIELIVHMPAQPRKLESPNPNKQLQECDLTKHLSQQRSNTQVVVTYHDFIYELTVSLFRIDNRIKTENSSLYIGLLFNLMCLLDVRINQYSRETAYRMIGEMISTINKRLLTGETPCLYLVLAHFLEPNYDELRKNGKPIDIAAENRKLKKHILRYYLSQPGLYHEHLKSLLVQKLPPLNAKSLTLKEAFFNEVDITSHAYQIKYLGNLYLNLLLEGVRINDPNLKNYILKGYVKVKLRVFKNILVLQGWKEELDRMKFEVAFEELRERDFENGFKRLELASKKQPTALVNYLNSDASRLEFLESLLSNSAACRFCGMLMEVLSLFYQSV